MMYTETPGTGPPPVAVTTPVIWRSCAHALVAPHNTSAASNGPTRFPIVPPGAGEMRTTTAGSRRCRRIDDPASGDLHDHGATRSALAGKRGARRGRAACS